MATIASPTGKSTPNLVKALVVAVIVLCILLVIALASMSSRSGQSPVAAGLSAIQAVDPEAAPEAVARASFTSQETVVSVSLKKVPREELVTRWGESIGRPLYDKIPSILAEDGEYSDIRIYDGVAELADGRKWVNIVLVVKRRDNNRWELYTPSN